MIQKTMTHVAVIIPNYNGRYLLEDCLSSLFRSQYESITQHVIVVDNNSSDGSVEYIKKYWPETILVETKENTGYAGANNIGLAYVNEHIPETEYIFLLNSDTIAEKNFLSPLVAYMDSHQQCGSVQSKLMLHPDTHKINSLGNRTHFLGFGYASFCGLDESSVKNGPVHINYCSGAAVMIRKFIVNKVGLFEDFMFMYLEDLDLGWKLLLTGWKHGVVTESVVYHKFDFARGMRQYYYFERNRLWILLKNYKLPTLILLFPAWVIMEIGQLFYAYKRKTIKDKLRGYVYFLSIKNLLYLYKRRTDIQKKRVVSDRQILREFTGVIDYQPIQEPLMKYVANPLFGMYLAVLNRIIFW